MRLFARWFYPLHVTVEHGEGETPADVLHGLRFRERVHEEDMDHRDFVNRLEPVYELWRRSGYWEMAHPWMEAILPWEVGPGFIERVLAELPPNALGPGGHVLLWPCRTAVSRVPLFMHPGGERVMGWGVLPGVPAAYLDEALSRMGALGELAVACGAKRYLSGYLPSGDPEKWAAHYGERWPAMRAAKRRFDPDGVLESILPL
ncbi:MAG: hypothetical protein K8I02_00050, partial [Candidatus Methylomirabilis sp.]|nr:hypothetical protein [Deltaproteobacteria bacterium]